MGDFFHGWRRKAGCVTLVVALVLTMPWIRSGHKYDFVSWASTKEKYLISSIGYSVAFVHKKEHQDALGWRWRSGPIGEIIGYGPNSSAEVQDKWWYGYDVNWRWELGQFNCGSGTINGTRVERYRVPYWFLVLPPTLLSAYLLLWPGKRAERQMKAPVEDK